MAGVVDLYVQQGASYSLEIPYTDSNGQPVDLTDGWSARLQIREAVADVGGPVQLLLTSEDGITLGDGTITIEMTSEQTAALDLAGDDALYDLELFKVEVG